MKNYTYLVINLIIFALPFIFSLSRRVNFYSKYKSFLLSVILVGIFFVTWDVWATLSQHWYFNSEYITGVKILNLPIEELLFFITVPYGCLFLYESIKLLLKPKRQLPSQLYLLDFISYPSDLICCVF